MKSKTVKKRRKPVPQAPKIIESKLVYAPAERMYCYEHPSIPYDGFYAAIERFKKTGGFAWKCGDNWILCVVEREGDLLRTNGILNALSDMLSQVDEKPSDISGYSIMRLNGRTIDWEAIVRFMNEEFGKKCLPIRVTAP